MKKREMPLFEWGRARALAVFGLIALALLSRPLTAVAQDYPSKDVRVIVPFSAGGGTDLVRKITTSNHIARSR